MWSVIPRLLMIQMTGQIGSLRIACSIADHEAYIDGVIDPILQALDGRNEGSRTLSAGEYGVYVAKEGQTINLSSGANAAAGGVVILDGGVLDVTGNQCFAGVVIFRNGGRITTANGTSAFLGSVIGYSVEDGPVVNPRLKGTPSFYYSDKGIQDAEDALAEALGPGVWFELVNWRAPLERPQ
jgi:hypothetical protein